MPNLAGSELGGMSQAKNSDHILLVDDRPENILPLKKILEREGYQIESAGSGEEALKKILRKTFALVILDVQMPGMDGFEVAESISGYSKSKDTPIIFLSAVNKEKKFVTQGYMSGGIDYITKPVDPEILLLKVSTFIRLHNVQTELRSAYAALSSEVEVRKKAENKLKALNSQLEQKVSERTAELVEKNKNLEDLNHELQQFAWVVAHDLKEPLRKIQTFNNLIKEKYLNNPDGAAYFDRTIAASQRMSRLIDDLLDYTRLSGMRLFEHTDMNALIDELRKDMMDVLLPEKIEINTGSIPTMDVIPGQMRQVFHNLFSNSLKFSKENTKAVVDISAERVSTLDFDSSPEENGPYCRITVSDNGIGFEQNFSERVFVIFQRLHARPDDQGTGIGLAIVKKIIERHHGLIKAESQINHGATFVIVLPIIQQKENTNE